MINNTEILVNYQQRNFKKCLEIISSLRGPDGLVENFVLENCKLICESLVRIEKNDYEKILEMREEHYLFFEKVTSVGIMTDSVPIQLKLVVIFNFLFWVLLCNDIEVDLSAEEEYLELINKALVSVLELQDTSADFPSASGRLLNNLMHLKDSIYNNELQTVYLILELVVVVISYVAKLRKTLMRDCLRVVHLFIQESKNVVSSIKSVNKFLKVESTSFNLFKFSVNKSGTLLSDLDAKVIDHLKLLEAVLLYLLEDYRGSLKTLQTNLLTSAKSLWSYLVILNSFELEDYDLCSGFLSNVFSKVVHNNLKARFHIMQGKLNCVERKHKEALTEFEEALLLSPNCSVIYYYLGQEYGKMGLIDSMVENFEKLVQLLQSEKVKVNFRPNFETAILNWIQPIDEISEAETYYALAVSYGMNENFKDAAEAYEKILQSPDRFLNKKKKIVEVPNFLTVLHEASVINLLIGNLVRAEQFALDAIDRYVPQKSGEKCHLKVSTLCKDTEWLQQVIQKELLEADMEPKELSKEILYTEDLLFFFPQNVIGLLILSEIQRIQDVDDCKGTLSKVFSTFSKYLASMIKKKELKEDEKHVLILVKALAGKTCLKIASFQLKDANDSNIEKMFKRALCCNKGDKDALYHYYKFLLDSRKKREALKVWNTFSKEKRTIEIDSLQSFFLRYFLTDKITNRELEKILREIDISD